MKDIYEVNILAFVQKCLSEECPKLFHDYYVHQPQRYPGKDQKLVPPHCKKNIGQLSLKYKGAKVWNDLNDNIQEKAHLKSFKKIVTKHYIERY